MTQWLKINEELFSFSIIVIVDRLAKLTFLMFRAPQISNVFFGCTGRKAAIRLDKCELTCHSEANWGAGCVQPCLLTRTKIQFYALWLWRSVGDSVNQYCKRTQTCTHTQTNITVYSSGQPQGQTACIFWNNNVDIICHSCRGYSQIRLAGNCSATCDSHRRRHTVHRWTHTWI